MKIHFDVASRWQLAEILERLDQLQSLLADACTMDEFNELTQHLDHIRSPILMALDRKWHEAYTAYTEHHVMLANKRTVRKD